MKKSVIAGALVLAAPMLSGWAAPAFAATPISTEQFVQKVAVSDLFEIESGRLAASHAQNAKVKSFGQRMVDDHSKTTEQLKQLVKDNQIDVNIPTELDSEHQAKLDELKNLSGGKFAQTYVPMQVSAHEEAVDRFQGYAERGENAELKQWAQKTLTALQVHLDEVKQLESEIGKTSTSAAEREEKQAAAKDDKARDGDVAKSGKDRAASFEYVTRQEPTDWTAQALIGRTVENEQGENLGDINNVILNEKGDVVAITIGVGGFLGIGEKDVGVPFEALEFRTEAAAKDEGQVTGTDTSDQAAERADDDRFNSEHSDMRIVLNATKDQLESAPDFVWLDEQRSDSAQEERVVR